jgi:hypothetical protein
MKGGKEGEGPRLPRELIPKTGLNPIHPCLIHRQGLAHFAVFRWWMMRLLMRDLELPGHVVFVDAGVLAL